MTQKEQILEILKDGGWWTVPDLIKKVYKMGKPASARLGARVWEIRQERYNIESKHVGGTTWAYRMIPSSVWKPKKKTKS